MFAANKSNADWDGKYDIEKQRVTGFIAQEVEQAARQCGYDFHGISKPRNQNGLYSLNYAEFVVPLVKAVQEQQQQIDAQQKQIDDLKALVQSLLVKVK